MAMGFETLLPVQAASVEPLLEGKDMVVKAPTGTGKTCAFGIPAVERADGQSQAIETVVLCPTRELVVQTTNVLRRLAACKQGVRIASIYGGEPIARQIFALKKRPQIIVATPGRLKDHMARRTIRLSYVKLAVLDEADSMLDMGFRDDMEEILKAMPKERQTVLFSATMSAPIRQIAKLYQREDALRIEIEAAQNRSAPVKQYYSEIRGNQKTPALVRLITEQELKRSLVFVATKAMADSLAKQLRQEGLRAEAIHGDLRQHQRDAVMHRYRSGQLRIMVATDVAARGIDVNNIDAVINYDIPMDCDSYVHRIGRTGRAGKDGSAYTFIYPKERRKLMSFTQAISARIQPLQPMASAT